MAKVVLSNETTELSYIDLCNMLLSDIKSDESMPEADRKQATALALRLNYILYPYSA